MPVKFLRRKSWKTASPWTDVRYTDAVNTKTVLSFVVLLCCAVVCSQRMPFGITGRAMLAMLPEVKKELNQTKAQDRALQGRIKELGESAQKGGQVIDFANPMSMLDPAVDEVLTDEQKKRIEELFIQANSGYALLDKRVAALMSLTEEQNASLRAINSKANTEIIADYQKARTSGAVKAVQKKHDDFGLQMEALLTKDQSEKFKQMQGKPFKFKS